MSDYFCVCEPTNGEQWVPLADEWRTARKEHRCCECLETIKRGERYHHDAGVLEGTVEAYKSCAFCYHERTRIQAKTDLVVCFGDLACCVVAELRGEL